MGERWDRDALCARLSERLSPRRFKHSLGVEACAGSWQSIGADREKASVRGCCTTARRASQEQARAMGQRLGIFEDTWLLAEPVLCTRRWARVARKPTARHRRRDTLGHCLPHHRETRYGAAG